MSFQIKYTYNLTDRISPQLRKIESNLRKTERQLQKTARKSNAAFNRMEKGTKSLGSRAIVPLTSQVKQLAAAYIGILGVTKVIGVLVNFDREMAKVKAVTRATTDQMTQLTASAKEMGLKTEFTAGQAAAAMAFLGLTGFRTNDILTAMPAVLDLATAGSLGLARAADISSNILKSFGLETSQLTRVIDVIALTTTSANSNIQQMGEAMKFVAPVAALAGVSIDTTSAALGVLGDSGIQATLGGTALRSILLSLRDPTKEAIKEFKKFGLTQKDIDIKSQGLIKVLKNLKPLIGVAGKIFEKRTVGPFAILANNIERLKEFEKQMKNVEGTGKKLADTMRDTLGGDLKALVSSIEGNVLALGEAGLTGALRGAAQATTIFFRAFTRIDAFNELGFTAKTFIIILRDLGKIIGFVLKVLAVGLKVALDTIDALLEGVMILIRPLLQLNDLLAGGIGKGFDIAKNLFSGEQKIENINTTNTINNAQANRRQEPQQSPIGGGILDINFNNAPRGSNASFSPDPKSNLRVGIHSNFANR